MSTKGVAHDDRLFDRHHLNEVFYESAETFEASIFNRHLINWKHGDDDPKLFRKATDDSFPIAQSSEEAMEQHEDFATAFIYKSESIQLLHNNSHTRRNFD
jgi:hypothetical protein